MVFFTLSFLAASLLLTSCEKNTREPSITIAEQYGLAYAPLQIMKARGFLEELNPSAEVQWVKLANTAAIREAVLAGQVDAGFMGIPPFLIGRDKNMPWKIATGLSRAPLGLVASESVSSWEDLTGSSRIALPQPGSIQHILLTMALDREAGDPALLDSSLVSMKHPDGMNALLSGAVQGHFTSPPYLFQELDQPGFSLFLSGEEAFGGAFTFIIGMVTEDFQKNHPALYEDYLTAVNQAVEFLNENPRESALILEEAYGLDRTVLEDYLSRSGMVYETEVRGVEGFLSFMIRSGQIQNLSSAEELFF